MINVSSSSNQKLAKSAPPPAASLHMQTNILAIFSLAHRYRGQRLSQDPFSMANFLLKYFIEFIYEYYEYINIIPAVHRAVKQKAPPFYRKSDGARIIALHRFIWSRCTQAIKNLKLLGRQQCFALLAQRIRGQHCCIKIFRRNREGVVLALGSRLSLLHRPLV